MREDRDDDAASAFNKALQLDPTCPGVHLRLGELHHRRGESETAKRHLRAELLLRPQDPAVLMDLSNLLVDTQQPRAAVACLKRLVQIESNNASAWQNLAVAQFIAGRYEDGIESCQECLRLDPPNAQALYNLALAYEHLGRFDEALSWVRRFALYLCPGPMPKKPRFDQKKEVRKLARERVGRVKPSRPIKPKADQQPKHKKPIEDIDADL